MRNNPRITEDVTKQLSQMFGAALKELLETKHLYQKSRVRNVDKFWESVASRDSHEKFSQFVSLLEADLSIENCKLGTETYIELGVNGGRTHRLTIILKNVKMYCQRCEDREPFAAVVYRDLDELLSEANLKSCEFPPGAQTLFLTYECQHCHDHRISVIIRRDCWELSLHGRSPMEEIELPSFIPKHEKHIYRDALIAMHGGKVLAALFYLRTFIEQFARRVTGITGRQLGDSIMEKYSMTLPAAQRDSIPSLRHWYDRLSDALHDAREDETLLEEALDAINTHFDIRRAFKMSEKK